MPLVELFEAAPDTRIGIWDVKEEESFFASRVPENYLIEDLSRFSERRRLEYLATRHLLHELLQKEDAKLSKDDKGKPHVDNYPVHISLSHTRGVVAVMISSEYHVGIDLEHIHHRIERIRDKFLNDAEGRALGPNPDTEMLILCWSAKESIYKIYGKKELEFKSNICLNLEGISRQDYITAKLALNGSTKEYTVNFRKIDENILTYVWDKVIE